MNYNNLPMSVIRKMQSLNLQPQPIGPNDQDSSTNLPNETGILHDLLQNNDHNTNKSDVLEGMHQKNADQSQLQSNSDRAWRRLQVNKECDQLKKNRGKRQEQYDKIRDQENEPSSSGEHNMLDDVLKEQAAILEIQQTKKIIIDQHKAINEYLLRSIQLFNMANNVDYDQDAYIKRGEEIFTHLADLATNCRNLMADLRLKAINE